MKKRTQPPTKEGLPPISVFIPATIILVVLGWGGFYWIGQYVEPSGGARWALFFTSILGLTGLALPAVAYLNQRFPSNPPPTRAIILRQAIWFGIYLPTLAWLQLGNVITNFLAALLGISLILIEYLLRLRERSQWDPRQTIQSQRKKREARQKKP